MQDKIDENDHKVGWQGLTVNWLLNRARQEMGEVKSAIERGDLPITVQRECADVANFMMMLADNYAQDYEEKNPPTELKSGRGAAA